MAHSLLRTFGTVPVYVMGSFCFFLLFMVLLNWRRFRYIQEISESVEHIAQGNFNDEIPVRQNNEVKLLAENMNLLVGRLKWSMEEERKAERSKNELVTNVSHDLRTPLTSIIGYLGLIDQDRYRDEIELRHYVQIAHAKAQRLNSLINDLFEYTRMSGGNLPLRNTHVNLVELMNQLLEHYRLPLEEAGMQGHLHTDTGAIRVWADPDKLVRIFENLLANAMTYGRDGGKVDIRLRVEAGHAVSEVINYGEPIPAGDLPYLFDRFYRVDKSRTGNERGSGLGLAIAKGLVEKHGGSIRAASDDRCTLFEVRFPLMSEIRRE
ncbi:HAMP domain-containing histidine kinase [Cohnella pontilimi]|uniref:histidine kinase n=2 Tax=Cohnella pontilimi TaxID=2564100 RepID=A0A4U0FHV1_9BACL|nr:HAMP domain-containing histidine kinase [Cohnella pontilimi]